MSPRDLVITLTSIPPRFGGLGARLEEILAQRPDALRLTLPNRYARFPDWDGSVPPIPSGVTLVRSLDLGPATKLVATASAVPEADLLICDDDCQYETGWLHAFRAARVRHPNSAIAGSTFDSARLRLPPGNPIVQGFAGVLLQVRWLLPRPPAPLYFVDDIWISASLAARSVPVIQSKDVRKHVRPLSAANPLQSAQIDRLSRAHLNDAAAQHFASAFSGAKAN